MYPFMEGASSVLKEKGISIDDLLTDIAYEPARTRANDRIRQSIELGAVSAVSMPKEADQLTEVLSFPVTRMILSCSGNGLLIARYALGEAMLLEARLLKEEIDDIIEIADDLEVEIVRDKRGFLIHFTSFLTATSSIRAKEWKLVNQEIFDGMVKVSKERLARILRQKLNDTINSELPRPVNDAIISVFSEDAKSFSNQFEIRRKEYTSGDLGPIDDSAFPPCMKTILTMMRNGENVPHTARFAITTFLGTLGMNANKIIELFSTAPDFDPSKSEYQIRHITGEISGTKYTPPECSTMKSYGNCYNPDQLCEKEWMTHPLKYYRNKKKRRGSRASKPSPDSSKSLDGGEVGKNDEDKQHDVEDAEPKAIGDKDSSASTGD